MAESLKLPAVRHYRRWLGSDTRNGVHAFTYPEETTRLLDELFHLMRLLEPVGDNDIRQLWLRVERGTPEDYGDVAELIEEGEFENVAEFYETWEWEFPNEVEWFELKTVENAVTGYRAVILGNQLVIAECDDQFSAPYGFDISEFVQWLVDAVRACIAMLREGTYNDFVRENLPPQYRTGTILRKHYFDIAPEEREDFFADISREDVEEFCRLAYAQPKTEEKFKERIEAMTAGDFYRFCAMGYAANNYEGCERTPKEQYHLNADGRDEGLSELDIDDPDAFRKWYFEDRFHIGHPWEVCRGGNSTHISLYVCSRGNESGYYLALAGIAVYRTIETVKFYLALRRAGVPVYLRGAELMADRLMEKEKIGIVPEDVLPAYCEGRFPNEYIKAFINLPEEDREKYLPYCVWQDIPEVALIETDAGCREPEVLAAFEAAEEEYRADRKTYTLEEVEQALGIE